GGQAAARWCVWDVITAIKTISTTPVPASILFWCASAYRNPTGTQHERQGHSVHRFQRAGGDEQQLLLLGSEGNRRIGMCASALTFTACLLLASCIGLPVAAAGAGPAPERVGPPPAGTATASEPDSPLPRGPVLTPEQVWDKLLAMI